MKVNKKIYQILLLSLLSNLGLNACDFKDYSYLEFISINNDSEYGVRYNEYYEGTLKDNEIIIPEVYNTKKVTTILERGFAENKTIASVTLPSSIKSIESGAFFECDNLSKINLPDGLKVINDSTFYSCDSLAIVRIPDSVSLIDESAFANSEGLKTVYLPSSLQTIGDYAFDGCVNIKGIEFPQSLKYIGDMAFQNTSIRTLTFPSSLQTIGEAAFCDCNYLETITFEENSVISEIKEAAFSGCNLVLEVTLPNSVTSLGDGVFSGCLSLYKITLPDTLDKIPNSAFSNTNLYAPVLPESITSIGAYAFKSCGNLGQMYIPEGVKTIGIEAFANCKALQVLKLPKSLTHVSNSAFLNTITKNLFYDGTMNDWCNIKFYNENSNPMKSCAYFSLLTGPSSYYADTLIILTNGVEKIGSYQFANSPHLAIIIPNSVKTIEKSALINSNIGTIFFEGSEEEYNQISIDSNNIDLKNCKVYYYAAKNSVDNPNHKYWDYDSYNEPEIW